jgi:transcriptional regulator with XRE-family HTH domain
MDIASWLTSTATTAADFAKRIGVSRQALHRYKTGDRVPRPKMLARIREETDGAVTANDFLPREAPSSERGAA